MNQSLPKAYSLPNAQLMPKAYVLPKRVKGVQWATSNPWATNNQTANNDATAYAIEQKLVRLKMELPLTLGKMIAKMLQPFPSITNQQKRNKEEIRSYLMMMIHYPMRQAWENKNQDFLTRERERMIEFKPAEMSPEMFYQLLDGAVDTIQSYKYKQIKEFWNAQTTNTGTR